MAPAPQVNGKTNGVNGSLSPQAALSADDNIKRFGAPSRPLSPIQPHTLMYRRERALADARERSERGGGRGGGGARAGVGGEEVAVFGFGGGVYIGFGVRVWSWCG